MFKRSRALRLTTQYMVESRRYLKVGDKIPISYIKEAPPITIKDDKEYPEWVFKLGEKVHLLKT